MPTRASRPDPFADLRPHLAGVWADREALVAGVAAEVIARVPTYATTPSSEVWIGMTRILERIIDGDPFGEPSAEDLAAAAGTGIQGARAGIAADDLVAAVLLGAREVEDEVMDRAERAGVPATVRLAATHAARRWAEDIAVAAVGALLHSGTPGPQDPGAALVAALREHADAGALVALAAEAGLDPGACHVVAVVRGLRGAAPDEVDAARLRFADRGGSHAAWARVDDALFGILPAPPTPVGELVIGTAGPAALDELHTALTRAERAARTAAALCAPGSYDLDALGLLVAVHEDPALRARLDRRRLEPLRAEPRHDLVRTVAEWQRVGQVEAVAHTLSVHPNTIRNRLARVDALLPGWRAPQAQAELWAALVADAAAHRENL